MNKFLLFINYLFKHFNPKWFSCPSCGHSKSDLLSRKYFVTSMNRCRNCQLLFRTPTTSPKEYSNFYQTNYVEGYTTEAPSQSELQRLIATKFRNSGRDYTNYINVLRSLQSNPDQIILDFGCSWGYGSWQIKDANFKVLATEISKPRRNFAKKFLDIDVVPEPSDLKTPIDLFFSSHVLEHIPEIHKVFDVAKKSMAVDGYLIAFTPNGSDNFRKNDPLSWNKCWGFVHPILIDDVFIKSYFCNEKIYIGTSPYNCEHIAEWAKNERKPNLTLASLDGNELLFIVKFDDRQI